MLKILQLWIDRAVALSPLQTIERWESAMPTKHEPDPPDFELRKYELDRAHELELNKFAHAFDVERLKILQLVNGGAFTVLIGFSSTLLQSDSAGQRWGLAAGLCWVGGLAAAAWAAQMQREVQACQNQSNRFRRNATEWRKLGKVLSAEELAQRVGPVKHSRTPPSHQAYDQWADDAYHEARNGGAIVKLLVAGSILLFVVGALLLTASVGLSKTPPPVPAEKASR